MLTRSISDVAFRTGGVLEEHVEEPVFDQIGGASSIQFQVAACRGYFMQSSLREP